MPRSNPFRSELKLQPRLALKALLMGRLRVARLFDLREPEFARLIQELETEPLFQSLLREKTDQGPIVRFQRFNRTHLASSFYDLKEDIISAGENVDVEGILSKQARAVGLIRRIGQEAFERYFLYPQEPLSFEGLSKRVGLAVEEVREIHNLVLELSVHSEFFHPSDLKFSQDLHFTPVARVEPEDQGNFSLAYLSPHLARGRYLINDEALQKFLKKKDMSQDIKRKVRSLIHQMTLVNLRHQALYRVLMLALETQREYLQTKEEEHLRPLSLQKAARAIGASASTVSRAIACRSLILPWGEEKPAIFLFPSQKRVVLAVLRDMSEKGGLPKTDATLAQTLKNRFGLSLSRRAVNVYRHELLQEKS